MLKRLLIFLPLLAVFSIQACGHANEAQQGTESQQPTAKAAGIFAVQNSDGQPLQNEAGPKKPYDVRVVSTPEKDSWDKAAVSVNIALAIVGLAGVIAAFVTLRILKRQTKAAETAANAALLSAQAVVNAERALLLFEVKKENYPGPHGPSRFHIHVVNYGHTPARRIEISEPIHGLLTLEVLAATSPDYGDELQKILEWLAPKESWKVATFVPNEHRAAIVEASLNANIPMGQVENLIYGQVTYDDGISSERRHSRYCLAHDKTSFSDIGGSLEFTGTPEYLECT